HPYLGLSLNRHFWIPFPNSSLSLVIILDTSGFIFFIFSKQSFMSMFSIYCIQRQRFWKKNIFSDLLGKLSTYFQN
ncbi:unnamed protein product, partial [Larinioides sclopetarius]